MLLQSHVAVSSRAPLARRAASEVGVGGRRPAQVAGAPCRPCHKALPQTRHPRHPAPSRLQVCAEQATCSTRMLQPACAAAAPSARRRGPLVVTANTERSNTTTKKRLSGPPGLPPINDNSGGGGGGGGWDGGKIARNLALNALFLGIYMLVDSGGPGGIFNGGGGGGELGLHRLARVCTGSVAGVAWALGLACQQLHRRAFPSLSPAALLARKMTRPLPGCPPTRAGGGGGGWGGWGWGSGGGGGGGGGNLGNTQQPTLTMRELDYEEDDQKRRKKKKRTSGSKQRSGGPQLAAA